LERKAIIPPHYGRGEHPWVNHLDRRLIDKGRLKTVSGRTPNGERVREANSGAYLQIDGGEERLLAILQERGGTRTKGGGEKINLRTKNRGPLSVYGGSLSLERKARRSQASVIGTD